MQDKVRDLEGRVDRIEQELAWLRTARSPQSSAASAPAGYPPPGAPPDGPQPVAPGVIASRRSRSLSEEELIGTWFPRIGALALVLGAGFGFKYAVDQGFIGPALRVVLGMVVGMGLLAGAEATHRKGWHPFAQAVAGGGLAMLYLSVWASWHLYGYLSPFAACLGLVAVSALGVVASLRHDGEALGVVAILGAFWSPFATGLALTSAGTTYTYVLAIDAAVISLAWARPWRTITKIAFTSTWLIFGAVGGPEDVAIAAATGAFVLFAAPPYLRAIGDKVEAGRGDVVALVTNGLVYYVAVLGQLADDTLRLAGPFTLLMAATYAVSALIALPVPPARNLYAATIAMSVFFVTVWSPIELDIRAVPLIWALESAALLLVAKRLQEGVVTVASAIVLAGSVYLQFATSAADAAYGFTSAAARVAFVAEIAVLYMMSLLNRGPTHQHGSYRLLGVIGAHALTLIWLSIETIVHFNDPGSLEPSSATQFALSGLWAVYAGGLLAAGIGMRSGACRVLSVVLFGLTILKMSVTDLWLLPTFQRLLGFGGIGILLIACSLMYHRFKAFLLEERPAVGHV